ncbi:MAG: hypothetical protein CL890_02665 [Dehalococcoidia bacterium]|nr:hypothetical protein [Dehalococcoidia bacterium]|tara:strand:- start:192 stop:491 length:300 start_codon:yes stop_codon:yes gene_type:complete
MNLIFLITISLACLIFLLYPYFNNSKNKINDLQIYSEIRRKKVLLELTSELENGTITQNQFNELKEELFKIESVKKTKSKSENIDPIEKIIESKKNQDV